MLMFAKYLVDIFVTTATVLQSCLIAVRITSDCDTIVANSPPLEDHTPPQSAITPAGPLNKMFTPLLHDPQLPIDAEQA